MRLSCWPGCPIQKSCWEPKAGVQLGSKPVQQIRRVRNWAAPGTEQRAVAVAVILGQVL